MPNDFSFTQRAKPADPPLLVDSKTAAKLLSICTRTLERQSAPKGPIPRVRIGRKSLYSVPELQSWIARSQGKAV